MNKLKYIFVTIVLIALINSCDSLWNGSNTTDVSFILQFPNSVLNGARTVSAQASVPSLINKSVAPSFGDDIENSDDVDLSVSVTLHKTSDDSIIDRVELSLSEAQNNTVTFKRISRMQKVYAKIEIINKMLLPIDDRSAIFFGASSNDVVVKGGMQEIIVKPNVVFLDPSITDPAPQDGLTPYTAVNTLEKAVAKLGGNPSERKDATIYVMDTINLVNGDTMVLDYPGLTLKRYSETAGYYIISMKEITPDERMSLVLKNITIDGSRELGFNVGPLIYIGSEASSFPSPLPERLVLTLEDGAVLKNNLGSGIQSYGKVVMNGGKIQHNETGDQYGGGGIQSRGGFLELNGGVISYNSSGSYWGGGVYTSGDCVLDGTRIEYNNSGYPGGGGIYAEDILFKSGRIANNTSAASGGGLYVVSNAVIINGEITNNTSSYDGGGVFLDGGSAAKLFLEGSPKIHSNSVLGKENNIFGSYESKNNTGSIVIRNALGESARAGVTLDQAAVVADDYTIATGSYSKGAFDPDFVNAVDYTIRDNDLKRFYSDNPEYSFSLDGEPPVSAVIIIAEKNNP